jgi:hypothetical protein
MRKPWGSRWWDRRRGQIGSCWKEEGTAGGGLVQREDAGKGDGPRLRGSPKQASHPAGHTLQITIGLITTVSHPAHEASA